MAFKLLMMAEKQWRKLKTAHLVHLIQAGIAFSDGETRILPELLSDSIINYPLDATLDLVIHNI